MVVSGGFLEVMDDKVIVLADAAERADDIDAARAEEAKKRAQEQMRRPLTGPELVAAEAALRRSLARLKVSERRKRRERHVP
jgi:F-type H+-transporting ATPase subunit epsilon